ncbi:hypothetical protein GSbR_03220 [Geobacter sp. SVR]|nr:hypothetical protein GSVR_40260 [Geobacter sp. SVR]GCF83722.1 hypothetical protein GSbR_03220 [Geobacter sp. SVR]
MSGCKRRANDSSLRHIPLLVIFLALLAPSLSRGETFFLLNDPSYPLPASEAPRQAMKVGLNENGNLTIRHNDVVSLTVAYPPPEPAESQERIRTLQQTIPFIGGIIFRVSFLF